MSSLWSRLINTQYLHLTLKLWHLWTCRSCQNVFFMWSVDYLEPVYIIFIKEGINILLLIFPFNSCSVVTCMSVCVSVCAYTPAPSSLTPSLWSQSNACIQLISKCKCEHTSVCACLCGIGMCVSISVCVCAYTCMQLYICVWNRVFESDAVVSRNTMALCKIVLH